MNTRNLFLEACRQFASVLDNPTPRNPHIDKLKRFFDNLNPAEHIPSNIQEHLDTLQDAFEHKTGILWLYTLATLVQQWILEPPNLRSDLLNAIGFDRLKKINTYACLGRPYESDFIENELAKSYFFFLLQTMLHVPYHSKLYKLYNKHIYNKNFVNSDLLIGRKLALLNQLNLNQKNNEHLAFWEQYVSPGLLNTGGHTIESYRVPKLIYKMIKNADIHKAESYEDFKQHLNNIRSQAPALSFTRAHFVNTFYRLPDHLLDNINLNHVNPSVMGSLRL